MYSLVLALMRLLDFYELLIIVWCVLSWIPTVSGTLADIKDVLGRIVSPYLDLFRSIIPPMSGIDFSPIVAILALRLVERLVVGILL